MIVPCMAAMCSYPMYPHTPRFITRMTVIKVSGARRGAKSQILGARSQNDARLLRKILDRSGLRVGARKSF
jgi:hypothetical protein